MLIAKLFEDNHKIKKVVNANRGDIRQLYHNMTRTLQKVGIVKYDAYQQMGGLLSFSLAILDEYNSGFILNSVHTSDGIGTHEELLQNNEIYKDVYESQTVGAGDFDEKGGTN